MINPDFVLLARSMGVHAIRCHTAEELPAKMKEFLEYDGSRPVLMECLVDKNEHVFPMVRVFFFSKKSVCVDYLELTIDLRFFVGPSWQSPP